MNPQKNIQAILDALALQQQRGQTSLSITIESDLILEAMNALRDYRKIFAPVIPGATNKSSIQAAYERMRQASASKLTVLVFVECKTKQEFLDALGQLPVRKSSEWRIFDDETD